MTALQSNQGRWINLISSVNYFEASFNQRVPFLSLATLSFQEASCLSKANNFDEFADQIRKIIGHAKERGFVLRIMGGSAIRMHCPKYSYLYEKLKRRPKHDMDFVTYGKFRSASRKLFVELGFVPFVSLMLSGEKGKYRQIFNDKEGNEAVDVFLDKLQMCHVIDFKGRLEVDSPTVPLAELLLQKLQIVEVNEKDIQDTLILLREHEIGDNDQEQINGNFVGSTLAKDWGFNLTVTKNLSMICDRLRDYPGLEKEDQDVIAKRIEVLRQRIDEAPKTTSWKMRSRLGESVRWYTVVDNVQRQTPTTPH